MDRMEIRKVKQDLFLIFQTPFIGTLKSKLTGVTGPCSRNPETLQSGLGFCRVLYS